MKRLLTTALAGLAIVAGVLLFNTITFKSRQLRFPATETATANDTAIRHLSESVQFRTISYEGGEGLDTAAFLGFHRYLARTYPLVHSTFTLTKFSDYSLLYSLKGTNTALKPVVLMAHQDVVPVEDATVAMWTVDPFAGVVKDGAVWGRGTADDKINVVAIMETLEKLLAEGFTPQRSIYLCFGHDEEIGGQGAQAMAKHLADQGIEADLVLDEGGIITKEKIPGFTEPVALIGTSEKGYLTVLLSVEKSGGHSSMPERETAIDILNGAIVRLRDHPFEVRFSPSTLGFMKNLGPEMPFVNKMAFANPWLFSPMIKGIYEKSPGGNAMIRTTLVPTILKAGIKGNVIPTRAQATVNLRLLPGDSAKPVLARMRSVINDERVNIIPDLHGFNEASTVTAENSFAYQVVNEAVKRSFNNVLTTPFLMIGATDSRHFGRVSSGIIKFSPMVDPIGFHGIDERVSIESFSAVLSFYEALIRAVNR